MKKIVYTLLVAGIAVSSTGNYLQIKAKETTDVSLSQQDMSVAMQKIKDNYRLYAAGDVEMNTNKTLASKIKGIDTNAKAAFQAYQGDQDAEELFKGISIRKADTQEKDNSDNYKTTAQKIYEMSLGYATSGTEGYQNSEYAKKILEALDKFYAVYSTSMEYNPGGLLYGNWWNWEIGVPTQLSNTFALMDKEIDAHNPAMLKQYVACFDNHLRNGIDGDVNLAAPQHTGTNLADITMNRVLQGAVTGDAKRIQKAADDMMSVFDTIDPFAIKNGNTDGVYADGSFIQHHRVAYTGSYGKLLLQRAIQSLIILNDTPWQPQGQLATLQNWIYKSFAPLTYEGYMMEMVKGRAVSRTGTGYQDTTGVIESMVLLSQRLTGNEKAAMQSQLKYMVESMPTKLNPASLTLSAVVPYEQIMADSSIAPVSQLSKGAYAFNAMDKNVQIGDKFAFALSRSSNRIAKYEYMSGENLKPWFQGDGAFHLYLSGNDQSKTYGVNYNATIDPYRLPGTTVPKEQRKTIPELYGLAYYPGYPAGSTEQNDYVYFPVGTNTISGSATLYGNSSAILQLGDDNAYAAKQKGLLANDFVAYKNANANKSWFMFGDKVVVLGSDVHDELGRDVTTTIDNQMSEPSDVLQTTAADKNGKKTVIQEGTYHDLKWINYGNTNTNRKIGYYFPENKAIHVKTDTRTGNLKDIRTPNPDKEVSEKFFTMTYEHGTNKNDTYSYVMLPNADEKKTADYASNPDITVLENSKTVHAVEDTSLKMKGYNFFEKGASNGIESSTASSILMKQEGDTITVAIADPTFTQKEIQITLPYKHSEIVSSDDRISVSGDDVMHIKANTSNLYGQTIMMKFTVKEESQTPGQEEKPGSQEQVKPSGDKGKTPTKPTEETKGTQTQKNPTTSPDTGDTTKPWLYAGLLGLAIVIMVVIRKHLHVKK